MRTIACVMLMGAVAFAGVPKQPKAGQEFGDNDIKLFFAYCPPGKFTMSNGDRPPVDVQLTQGFWIGTTEISQKQWRTVMGTAPWADENRHKNKKTLQDGENLPATEMTWAEANAFCVKMTDREHREKRAKGMIYRLPTEAEWEYACRAGTDTKWSFGDDETKLGNYAWYSKNSKRQLQDVGKLKPNKWGLHDVHGNVEEWCLDAYANLLPGGKDPFTPGDKGDRVVRGGYRYSEPSACTPTYRRAKMVHGNPDLSSTGFRVVMVKATTSRPTKKR